MFVAGTAIFKSTDNGTTWNQVADWNQVSGGDLNSVVSKLGYSSGVIFAGMGSSNRTHTSSSGILRSTDNGDSWSFSNYGLTDHKDIEGIACDGLGNVFVSIFDDGAYKSSDNGSSWNKISEIPEWLGASANSFPSLGTFLGFNTIGTNNSALYRYKNGVWDTIPGYDWMGVISIAQVGSNKIVVGTHKGVYITTFDTTSTGVKDSPNSLPENFALHQNYPNPFNPSTTIEFSISKRTNVNLTIYNCIGQKIETLVDREMNSGSHQITWNAGKYPSGTYFANLTTDNGFKATKKILLVK
jgi:hypothetical protein